MILTLVLLHSTHAVATERPKGWLFIPSLSIYKPVYVVTPADKLVDITELGGRVAWISSTAWLDTTNYVLFTAGGSLGGMEQLGLDPDKVAGRIAITGHGISAFRRLDEIRIGALIIVGDYEETREYTVSSITVWEEKNVWEALIGRPNVADLVLITCQTDDLRLVVTATAVEY